VEDSESDSSSERRVRTIAVPLALALALVVYLSPLAHVGRIFLSMWVHELGHAVTAWLSGFVSFPGPWKTEIAEERSAALSILLAAGLIAGAVLAWRARRRGLAAVAAAALATQLVLTVFLRAWKAQMLITFMGDGGGLVLGASLCLAFYATTSSIRFGLLAIGACGLMDPLVSWWRARQDWDAIAFGQIEGVGDSDPTKLVEEYGWGVKAMITRYLVVGGICLLVVAIAWLTSCRSDGRTPRPPA
jgi:hypothetical protein